MDKQVIGVIGGDGEQAHPAGRAKQAGKRGKDAHQGKIESAPDPKAAPAPFAPKAVGGQPAFPADERPLVLRSGGKAIGVVEIHLGEIGRLADGEGHGQRFQHKALSPFVSVTRMVA